MNSIVESFASTAATMGGGFFAWNTHRLCIKEGN
jgi:hypothetical protein